MSGQALFLLVEDNAEDILLIRRALNRARVTNPLNTVQSGEEAIAYLSGRGKYSNRAEFPLPAVVLLDIRMPGLEGLDVLQWIRQQSGLRTVRVVMVTASDDTQDVTRAYQLGADSYLVKPLDFERFTVISQALGGYWNWSDRAPEWVRPLEVKGVSDTEIFRREVRAQHP